jgi:hypothetical protein
MQPKSGKVLLEEFDLRKKDHDRKLFWPKAFFAVLFAAVFLVASKTKMLPILGTDLNFSIGAMFGPITASVLGIGFGLGSIVLADVVGIAIGLYSLESIYYLATFVPALIASLYFARSFKDDRKTALIPIACMAAFLANPIGREVWFYSLFWLIPAATVFFKKNIDGVLRHPALKVYSQSLGSAFTDHAVGSVVYLYLLNIPSQFWIAAIPMTIIERLIIALGIDFSYHAVKKAMSAMQDAMVGVANQVARSQAHGQKTESDIKLKV